MLRFSGWLLEQHMRKHILAIDSSKAVRHFLQTMLGQQYHTVTAPDGYSALYYLKNNATPDLIICDPVLPDFDDWELIEHFTDSIQFRTIPILVVAHLAQDELQEQSLAIGIQHYLQKPLYPGSLMLAIGRIMEEKHSLIY